MATLPGGTFTKGTDDPGGANTPDSTTGNIGFRVAADVVTGDDGG